MNPRIVAIVALIACGAPTSFEEQLGSFDERLGAVEGSLGKDGNNDDLANVVALVARVDELERKLDRLDADGEPGFTDADVDLLNEALAAYRTGDLKGEPGVDGLACWDVDPEGEVGKCDPSEDTDGIDGCDVRDCHGIDGRVGADCWDDLPCAEDGDESDCDPADCNGLNGNAGANCWEGLGLACELDGSCTPADCLPDLTGYATQLFVSQQGFASSQSVDDLDDRLDLLDDSITGAVPKLEMAVSLLDNPIDGRVTVIENDYATSTDLGNLTNRVTNLDDPTVGRVDLLEDEVGDLETSLADAGLDTAPGRQNLADLLSSVLADGGSVFFDGVDVIVEGGNLYVRNGTSLDDDPYTDDGLTYTGDGTGNLILGWNADNVPQNPRNENGGREFGGSHNLIIGDDHSWPANGGFASGYGNWLGADGVGFLGGISNESNEDYAGMVGGRYNAVGYTLAGALAAGAVGGENNDINGIGAVAVGGEENDVRGGRAVAVGGYINRPYAPSSVVVGGVLNTASDDLAQGYMVVIAGQRNTASGQSAVTVGGTDNDAVDAECSFNSENLATCQ